MLTTLLSLIDGYKTYIIAAGMIAYAILGYGLGHIDQDTLFRMVMEGLAFSGARHAIAKLE